MGGRPSLLIRLEAIALRLEAIAIIGWRPLLLVVYFSFLYQDQSALGFLGTPWTPSAPRTEEQVDYTCALDRILPLPVEAAEKEAFLRCRSCGEDGA